MNKTHFKWLSKFFIFVSVLMFTVSVVNWAFANSDDLIEGKDKKEQLISMDYKDASLASVLRALSYSYDLNLVITKDVTGTVSVSLRNVSIDEALHAILNVNGYTFSRQGSLIYITSGGGTDRINQMTVAMPLRYLTASEAEVLLSKVISEKGDIQVNETTNSLVVTDFKTNIDKIKGVLSDIDVQPIQVLIEAKIVDIQTKAFENLGTTTSFTYDPQGVVSGLFNRSTGYDENLTGTTSFAGPSTTLSGGQMALTATIKGLTSSVTLDALIEDNKANILASPSIATLSGKEARIIIGEKFPYKEKTQTTTGTTETTRFIDVGTTLRVTPIVSPDHWITMNVHPEVSSVAATLDAGPRITTREADATIRVKNGETIIIGGLINKKDSSINGGVPYVRKVPVLGALFSRKSKDIEETELTVFITPKVIESARTNVAKNDIVDEEVYLSIEGVGNANLVAKLFEHADSLSKKRSVISSSKTEADRMEAMLNTYKMIVTQFPTAKDADLALFKMGELYFDYFAEYPQARISFEKLIAQYPESPYRMKAIDLLNQTYDIEIQGE